MGFEWQHPSAEELRVASEAASSVADAESFVRTASPDRSASREARRASLGAKDAIDGEDKRYDA